MIHVNKGEQQHEWLTHEEFEQKYPEHNGKKILPKTELIKRQKGLRERREIAGMTLRQLSGRLGMSVEMLSDIEIGAIRVGDGIFNRIVAALEAAERGE